MKRRVGFTLIEVVVGMVLMASLVATTLLAMSSHQRGIQRSQQRRLAATLVDAMLVRWYDGPQGVPPRSTGVLAGSPGWLWRTEPVGVRVVLGVPCQIIRLQIVGWGDSVVGRTDGSKTPVQLLEIELLRRNV